MVGNKSQQYPESFETLRSPDFEMMGYDYCGHSNAYNPYYNSHPPGYDEWNDFNQGYEMYNRANNRGRSGPNNYGNQNCRGNGNSQSRHWNSLNN